MSDWRRWCRDCEKAKWQRARGPNSGQIPLEKVLPFANALIAKNGSIAAAARESGVCYATLWQIHHERNRWVFKKTAAKILSALRR